MTTENNTGTQLDLNLQDNGNPRFTALEMEWSAKDQPANPDRLSQTDEEISPIDHTPLKHKRRKLSGKKLIIAAGLLTVAGSGLGYAAGLRIPNLLDMSSYAQNHEQQKFNPNPYKIGEGEPKNGSLRLQTDANGYVHEDITSLLKKEHLAWFPDGRTPYVTVLDENGNNVRRYFFSGGPDNASYMVQTDGTKPLEQMLKDDQVHQNDFVEVFGPDVNVNYRKYYAGITSVLQLDNSNSNHLIFIYHGENRPARDDSGKFNAVVGWAESKDGGKTIIDKGPLILGTDTKNPGYIDSLTGQFRVTGAGEPSAIYNPKDGYVHFAWVDWKSNDGIAQQNRIPDQIYGARAIVNENGTFGPIEYWTNDGYSTNFDKNTLKAIIPVPKDQPEMKYVALPSIAWSTELNKFVATGESDNGFWTAQSTDLVNWTEPQLIYKFTQPVFVNDPGRILGPYDESTPAPGTTPTAMPSPTPIAGEPHSILQPGQLWESYPTLWDESKSSSDVIGNNVVLLHSAGNNELGHQPAFINGNITNN
jgi:hypothetical protein